jgi:hypothetical protein
VATTHVAHAARYGAGVFGRYRSYGASHSVGATRPCSADKMNHGTPSFSAYARSFLNRLDVYKYCAAQGWGRFVLTQLTTRRRSTSDYRSSRRASFFARHG